MVISRESYSSVNQERAAFFEPIASTAKEIDVMHILATEGDKWQDYMNQAKELVQQVNGNICTLIHPFHRNPTMDSANSPQLALWHDSLAASLVANNQEYVWDLCTKHLPRFFVHEQLNETYQQYHKKLAHFFRGNRQPVIFIGESALRRTETHELIRALGYQGTILFYDTRPTSPFPEHLAGPMRPWIELAENCEDLGIKRFIVGGQFIYWKPSDFSSRMPGLAESFQGRKMGKPVILKSEAFTMSQSGFAGCIYAFMKGVGSVNGDVEFVLSPLSWPQPSPEALSDLKS